MYGQGNPYAQQGQQQQQQQQRSPYAQGSGGGNPYAQAQNDWDRGRPSIESPVRSPASSVGRGDFGDRPRRPSAAFGKKESFGNFDMIDGNFDVETGLFTFDGHAGPSNLRMMKNLIRTIYIMFIIFCVTVGSGHSYTFSPPSDPWLRVFAKYELFLVFAGFIQAIGFWLLAVKTWFYESVDCISKPAITSFAISFAARLFVTLTTDHYDPNDGTWDFKMVQGSELLGLLSCLFLLYQFFQYPKTVSNQGGVVESYGIHIISAVCAVFFFRHRDEGNALIDMLWMFSIWEEALAMGPQLLLVMRRGQVEFSISHFMFMAVISRFFHGLFWLQVLWKYGEFSFHALGIVLQVLTEWGITIHFFVTFVKMVFLGRDTQSSFQNIKDFFRSL